MVIMMKSSGFTSGGIKWGRWWKIQTNYNDIYIYIYIYMLMLLIFSSNVALLSHPYRYQVLYTYVHISNKIINKVFEIVFYTIKTLSNKFLCLIYGNLLPTCNILGFATIQWIQQFHRLTCNNFVSTKLGQN